MHRFILCTLLMISTGTRFSYAQDPSLADVYIKKFDETLDAHLAKPDSTLQDFVADIVDSGVYPNLQALKEQEVEVVPTQELPNLESVTSEPHPIESEIQKIPDTQIESSHYLPSTGPKGNITGDQFASGVWSLTFDDGPNGRYTPHVLKNLLNFGMRATFFMLAQQVKTYPQLAMDLKIAGMEIANHSYSHAQLTRVSASRLYHEIHDSQEVFRSILGLTPQLFRLPYGAGVHQSRVRASLAKENLIHVFWNVDSLDWHDRNPESIVARVKKQMALARNQGGIILFHDIHPQSVEASRQLMKLIFEANRDQPGKFQIVPVGEVIRH